MALIGKIRKHSWLLIVVIGLALAAFVIMDMTGQGGPGAQQLTLVEVDGEKVDWTEFQNAERILYTGSQADVFSRRNYLYNYFLDRTIIGNEAEANGLSVPRAELMDLQFGTNLSQLIQQRFADPNTGLVDRTQLNNIKATIDQGGLTPSLRELWAYQEKEVMTERLTNKLTNIVAKGFYTPTWMVEATNIDQTERTDFTYVKVPYDQVPSSDVSISESDLKAYLNEHKAEYAEDEETRVLSFVSFNVLPTPEDSAALEQKMNDLVTGWTAENVNDTFYVENNYGTVDFAYVKRPAVSPLIADSVFQKPIGSVVGPYMEGNALRAAKILDRKIIADSVHTRHILRRAQTLEEYQAAQRTADSLVNLIESGAFTFDSLAQTFNQGSMSVSVNGGDLGNVALGGFVKPFNDLVFFNAEKNKLYTVITEFGVHVVEVLDWTYETNQEGVQLAYLVEPIIPSENTQENMYNDVLDFVSTNRTLEDVRAAIADRPELHLELTMPVKQNDFTINSLGTSQTSRDMIRYAFEPGVEVGDVSPEVFIFQDLTLYYNGRYVVAGLSEINPAGQPSLEALRPTIEGLVSNEKKAEILKKELEGKTLEQVAEIYDTQIDTARGVNFLTDFIANLGEEPSVASAAVKVPLNEVSRPIGGTAGVYLIKPFNRTEATPANIPSLRASYTNQIAGQAKAGLMQSLRKNADIEDNRYRFY